MKVIDLFNKIANGEEVPKKIKYKNKIYEYREQEKGYCDGLYYLHFNSFLNYLNDEIEIIEEPKELKKITWNEKSKYKDWTTSDFDRMLMNRTEQLKKGLNELIEKKYKVSLKKDSWEECIPKKIEKLPYYSYQHLLDRLYKSEEDRIKDIVDVHEKRINDYHNKLNEIIDKLNEADVNE